MRHKIYIPNGSLNNGEIETIIGKLAMCGYSVRRSKEIDGPNKNMRFIEYWIEKEEQNE